MQCTGNSGCFSQGKRAAKSWHGGTEKMSLTLPHQGIEPTRVFWFEFRLSNHRAVSPFTTYHKGEEEEVHTTRRVWAIHALTAIKSIFLGITEHWDKCTYWPHVWTGCALCSWGDSRLHSPWPYTPCRFKNCAARCSWNSLSVVSEGKSRVPTDF